MIRVRLKQDIGLGLHQRAGNVIEVAEGYGRSYLIAHGFAERVQDEHKAGEWDPRPLSDREALDASLVLTEFRRQMFHGGVRKWSVNGLSRVFDSVNRASQDDELTESEFEEALAKFGVFISSRAVRTLFRVFDQSGNGRLNYVEFVAGLRGPLNERRHRIVTKAWAAAQQIAAAPGGIYAVGVFNDTAVQGHPAVTMGADSPAQVSQAALANLARITGDSAVVDEQSFFRHFTDIGAAIDCDDIFVSMIEKQFAVSERDDEEEIRAAVRRFRQGLLDKLDQRAFQGGSAARTLLRAFQIVNSDSMGGVTLTEFRLAMESLGFQVPDLERVFATFDRSGDNMIDYNEFVAAMTQD